MENIFATRIFFHNMRTLQQVFQFIVQLSRVGNNLELDFTIMNLGPNYKLKFELMIFRDVIIEISHAPLCYQLSAENC